ncbi:MAG TPA: hypothetical protein VMS77_03660 [Conexivisphaerales archaeon]|nr:hypothetical protein [Conexivisphaerales archaeon]
MGSSARQGTEPGATLYDVVRSQLEGLSSSLGLERQHEEMLEVYREICRESMAIPVGTRPPGFSRINADGTPFQYSLALGPSSSSLHFLGEAGVPGTSISERLELSRRRLTALADFLGIGEDLASVSDTLDQLVPSGDRDLQADASGALWIGAGFSASSPPSMTAYANTRWGTDQRMWERLESLFARFGEPSGWGSAKELLASGMKPLGAAVTIGGRKPPRGRVYLSAYGNPHKYYSELVGKATNEEFSNIFEGFLSTMLADDVLYPIRSSVCSFGVGDPRDGGFKFELCGHCSLLSDGQVRERYMRWLVGQGIDGRPYEVLLDSVSRGPVSARSIELHSYLGVGRRMGDVYSTVYLQPSWRREATS